jgi:hypothetical protein
VYFLLFAAQINVGAFCSFDSGKDFVSTFKTIFSLQASLVFFVIYALAQAAAVTPAQSKLCCNTATVNSASFGMDAESSVNQRVRVLLFVRECH